MVISIFAGCGGSSLGYKWAGYKELLGIDYDKNVVKVFKLNFPEIPIWQEDIGNVSGEEILAFCKIKKKELDILDGSPPCQGFSTTGKRRINDFRNDLFKDYIRLIQAIQPKIFIMENVSGMVKGKMKGRFIEIITEIKKQNYQVKCKLLNAMWYEVPQSRERLFFIGIRKDLNTVPTFPQPSKNIIIFKEAVKGLKNNAMPPPLSKCVLKFVFKMKQGQNGSNYIKGKHSQTLRIYEDRVCPTVTVMKAGIGFDGLIHPYEDRVLSINELKKVCSFPDDFQLLGNYQEQKASLGNAVMPKQMYHIAKHIKENILNI